MEEGEVRKSKRSSERNKKRAGPTLDDFKVEDNLGISRYPLCVNEKGNDYSPTLSRNLILPGTLRNLKAY